MTSHLRVPASLALLCIYDVLCSNARGLHCSVTQAYISSSESHMQHVKCGKNERRQASMEIRALKILWSKLKIPVGNFFCNPYRTTNSVKWKFGNLRLQSRQVSNKTDTRCDYEVPRTILLLTERCHLRSTPLEQLCT